MAELDQDQERKKKQHRSPAYPAMPLKEAIGHAETIYKHERRSTAPVAVVAEHCGTDIKSSKALRLIAALKQFGLVVEEGSGEDRQVRLSDRALDIILSDDPDSRQEAIAAAALAPTLHRKIWEHYLAHLPSDPTLKVYLLRQHDFNDIYVDRFIKQFKATLEFAGLAGGDTMTVGDEEEPLTDEEEPMNATLDIPKDKLKPPPPASGLKDFPLYTAVQRGALYVPAKMTKADFELLKRQIDSYLLVIEATSVQKDSD